MTDTEIGFKSNTGVEFTMPFPKTTVDSPSVFVVAAHKTGSVLLNNIISDICEVSGLPSIPVEIITWRQGISIGDWPSKLYELMNSPGYIYYGFRALHRLTEIPLFGSATKIFLVRDPRDMLISYYFSIKKSHGIPEKGTTKESMKRIRNEVKHLTPDEFVLSGKGDFIIRNMGRFKKILDSDKNAHVFKYEDVIFNKCLWVHNLSSLCCAKISEEEIVKIAQRHDILPENEMPNKHVRQVRPGNYKKHFSREVISWIQNNHRSVFYDYGYKLD